MATFRTGGLALAVGLVFAVAQAASAQTTYSWNGARTDWAAASSWTPNGVPGAADTALFENTVSANPLSLPVLNGNAQVGALHFDYNLVQLDTPSTSTFGTPNTFLGNGHTLTVGNGGSQSFSPVRITGSVDRIGFENLQVALAAGTTLTGDAAVNGVLTVDTLNRLALLNNSNFQAFVPPNGTLLPVTLNGGGLVVDGTSSFGADTIRSFGGNMQFIGGSSTTSGATTIHGAGGIQVLSGQTTVNLSQITSPPAGQSANRIEVWFGQNLTPGLSIPLSSRGLVSFSVPRTAGIGKIILNGYGSLVSNGLIRDGSTPYVTTTNSDGDMRWATYDPNNNNGVVPGAIVTRNGTALSSGLSTENVVSRPQGATLSNDVTLGSLAFDLSSADTLNLGGNTLTTNGVILTARTGSPSLTISNGTLAGTGGSVRHVVVNLGNQQMVLNGVNLASGGPLAKSGSGTLVLAGTSDLVNFANTSTDVSINNGAIRAVINGPQATFGLNNNLRLRGGYLEADAQGGTATFTRTLGTGAGQVNWATSADDHGNGGFKTFNGNLTVNLGNDGHTLTWDSRTGESQFFVRDGNSLRFNTPVGTGRIDFVNNLNLDGGTAGIRTSRAIEAFGNINLTADARPPAERTRLTGTISGGPSANLNYGFGDGFIEVTGANTYAGDTHVSIHGLIVSNTAGSATGTGNVRLDQAYLMGTGTIAPASGKNVLVAGGTIFPQSDAGPSNLTIGSAGADNDLSFRKRLPTSGDSQFIVMALTPTQYGRLTVRGTGDITIDGAALTVGLDAAFTPSASDVFGILDNQTANPITGGFNGIANGGRVNAILINGTLVGSFQVSYTGNISGTDVIQTGGNDLVLYNFQPVPEPSGLLAAGAAAAGLVGFLRRRRRSARLA
ncbi:MAG TPA: hypothetical protein VFG68_03895 [Fimbriiglobus sp.]|nr:hypothetical protein [Fimbriiglobus sp.]